MSDKDSKKAVKASTKDKQKEERRREKEEKKEKARREKEEKLQKEKEERSRKGKDEKTTRRRSMLGALDPKVLAAQIEEWASFESSSSDGDTSTQGRRAKRMTWGYSTGSKQLLPLVNNGQVSSVTSKSDINVKPERKISSLAVSADSTPKVRIVTDSDTKSLQTTWIDKDMLEDPDSASNIILRDGENSPFAIKGATFEKLTERLTLFDEHPDYEKYFKTFFTTYRSFASPEQVFEKLRDHYRRLLQRTRANLPRITSSTDLSKRAESYSSQPKHDSSLGSEECGTQDDGSVGQEDSIEESQCKDDDREDIGGRYSDEIEEMSDETMNMIQESKERQAHRRMRLCEVIEFWFSEHFLDYKKNTTQLELIKSFTQELSTSAVDFLASRKLISTVQKKLEVGTYVSVFGGARVIQDAPLPKLPKEGLDNATFQDLDELEIARQLTITDSHTYADIEPLELQNQAWSKEKWQHLSPHVLEFITRFNRLSNATATMVVSTKKLKDRLKVVEKFLRIAVHLQELNNFNSLMAIFSGLNSSAVFRLKHTFSALNKKSAKVLDDLKTILDSANSYKVYREAVESASPPCVPFLGVYLTDLTFIEDGNQDTIQNGLINFGKRQLEYGVIIKVLKFQSSPYNFKLIPKIISIIGNLPTLTEEEQYKLSLVCEPRNAKKKDLP